MPDPSPLPSAFDALPLVATGRPRVFLDYDGTLTPIVARPEDAVLAPEMREVLARLVEVAEVTVVTGRDVDDVLALLAPLGPSSGVAVAGSHGFELARPDGRRDVLGSGEAFLPTLDAAARRVEAALPSLEGVRLERKRFALALHFREAPEREAEVVALASEVASAEPLLRVGHGKMVVELRPDTEWDKGRLVSALLASPGEGAEPRSHPHPNPPPSRGRGSELGSHPDPSPPPSRGWGSELGSHPHPNPPASRGRRSDGQPDAPSRGSGEGSPLPRSFRAGKEAGTAVYLGDDVTDEDAFEAMTRLDPPGIGVVVGERGAGETAARYALADVPEVQRWLEDLGSRLEGSGA